MSMRLDCANLISWGFRRIKRNDGGGVARGRKRRKRRKRRVIENESINSPGLAESWNQLIGSEQVNQNRLNLIQFNSMRIQREGGGVLGGD